MGTNKKKVMHTAKEERQGKKVLIGIAVAMMLLVILMFVLYSV